MKAKWPKKMSWLGRGIEWAGHNECGHRDNSFSDEHHSSGFYVLRCNVCDEYTRGWYSEIKAS